MRKIFSAIFYSVLLIGSSAYAGHSSDKHCSKDCSNDCSKDCSNDCSKNCVDNCANDCPDNCSINGSGKHRSGKHCSDKHCSDKHCSDKHRSDKHCPEDNCCEFHGGSFIGIRPPRIVGAPGILDQFIFHADGTVYFNQSTQLQFPNTQGTTAAEVGTWTVCGCYVIATTVGYSAFPVAIDGGGTDLNVSNYSRSTQKFKIIDKCTLSAVNRVFRSFTFDQNPLIDSGTVLLDSRAQFELNRVKVLCTDLNSF